jgi:hypothetical protein
MRILTLVPPTSTTRTFGEAGPGVDLIFVFSGIGLSAGKYISSSAEFGGTEEKSVDFHFLPKDGFVAPNVNLMIRRGGVPLSADRGARKSWLSGDATITGTFCAAEP